MVPRRVPASQPSADGADPRLSLRFLLNTGGTTGDGSRQSPTPETVPGVTERHPPALAPHPEAHAPLYGMDYHVGRGRATDHGVAPMGAGTHVPLPPPLPREVPGPPVTWAQLHERFPPSLPLPAWRPLPLPQPPPLPPPTRPTLAVTATPAATNAPAAGQDLFAPPLTTAGGEMTATQGFTEHGVRWNSVTERYDVSTTEATEAHPAFAVSGGTVQKAGRGDQEVWPGPPAAVKGTVAAAPGTGVGMPSPPRHPDPLAAPLPDSKHGHEPTPVSRAVGPLGVHATRGGSPMEGATGSTAGVHGRNTGGGSGRNGIDDSGSLGGAVGAVGDSNSIGGCGGGRGGVRRGVGCGGGGRSRRVSGGRPRVPCSRDGCTSTFAQRAGALRGGEDRFPYILRFPFYSFRGQTANQGMGGLQAGAAGDWKG